MKFKLSAKFIINISSLALFLSLTHSRTTNAQAGATGQPRRVGGKIEALLQREIIDSAVSLALLADYAEEMLEQIWGAADTTPCAIKNFVNSCIL